MRTYLQDLDAMAWRVEWTPSVTDHNAPNFMKSNTGVYLIPVESWVFFICALRLRPTFTPQKASQKLDLGRKPVYEIDP